MNKQELQENSANARLSTIAAGLADCKGPMNKANQLVTALKRLEISAGHEAILKELEATMNQLAARLEKVALTTTSPDSPGLGKILAGLRVLLAEDDDIAAAMTTRMLERNNANVTRSHDGKAAVAMATANEFDIILMDVQMPEMSGLAATKIIRNERHNNTPIIALTAGKVENNSSYAEAGMNAAIAKPYKEQKLIEAILQCFTPDNPATTIHKTHSPSKSLYSLDKLTAMGDQVFLIRMLNLFIEQVPASVSRIKEAYHNSDFDTVKYLTHRLRPSIRNMGITSAEGAVDLIEEMAEARVKSTEMEKLITKMEEATTEVVLELKKYLEGA